MKVTETTKTIYFAHDLHKAVRKEDRKTSLDLVEELWFGMDSQDSQAIALTAAAIAMLPAADEYSTIGELVPVEDPDRVVD